MSWNANAIIKAGQDARGVIEAAPVYGQQDNPRTAVQTEAAYEAVETLFASGFPVKDLGYGAEIRINGHAENPGDSFGECISVNVQAISRDQHERMNPDPTE